ncbi:MAG TPA: helix-hairpin-helix domain-containing protein [Polyangiaceae bacterium]
MPSRRSFAEATMDPGAASTPCDAAGGGRAFAAPAARVQSDANATKRTWLALWSPVLLKLALAGAALTGMALIGVLSERYELEQRPDEQWRLVQKLSPTLLARANAAPLASAAPASSAQTTHHADREQSVPADASDKAVPVERKIILNVATSEELQRLPGVGQKRAEAIIELRTRLKGFKRLTDLLRVKGIGPRGLKRMLPLLELNPPAGDAGAPS